MSVTELLVIVFGLFLGYWVVSRFFSGSSRVGPRSGGTQEAGTEKDAQSSPAGPSPAWHEVLNVSPQATVEEIQHAYNALARRYPPNMAATLSPELRESAERKSKQIAVAYREAMQSRESAT